MNDQPNQRGVRLTQPRELTEQVWAMTKIVRESEPLQVEPWANFKNCQRGISVTLDAETACQALVDAGYRLGEPKAEGDPQAQAAILQAVARGWCTPKNSHKEMDVDLATAIAQEVEALFSIISSPAEALLKALEQWTCPSCGGSKVYRERPSARNGYEGDPSGWEVPCKVCGETGLNPIASAAIAAYRAQTEAGASEKAEPNPMWEAIADRQHAAIIADVGVDPAATLSMLKQWKADAEPANEMGQISFSRAMLDSACDALELLLTPPPAPVSSEEVGSNVWWITRRVATSDARRQCYELTNEDRAALAAPEPVNRDGDDQLEAIRTGVENLEALAAAIKPTLTCFECGHDLEGPFCPACNPPLLLSKSLNDRAKIICDFMSWSVDSPSWISAQKLAGLLTEDAEVRAKVSAEDLDCLHKALKDLWCPPLGISPERQRANIEQNARIDRIIAALGGE